MIDRHRRLHPLEQKLFGLVIKKHHDEDDVFAIKNCVKLIKKSKDIPPPSFSARTGYGSTPLTCAVNNRNLAVTKILIEEKAYDDTGIATALFVASREGCMDIVCLLIKENNNIINIANYLGNTALMGAASTGRNDIVQTLIASGALLELKERREKTALDVAICESKCLPVIRTLLEAGSCINKPQLLFDFLERKCMQQKSEDAEDIYVCLSILCEQQERLREETAVPEKPQLSEEFYQKAENMLQDLSKPSGVTYKLRRDAVIEKIDTVTNQLFPLRYPKEVNQMIAEYDNPFRHQIFNIQKNPKETVLNKDEHNKKKKIF